MVYKISAVFITFFKTLFFKAMHKDKRFYNVFTDVNGPSKFLVKYYSIFLVLLILTQNEIVLKNICIFIFTILRNVMDHRILKQIGQNSATLNHIRFLRLISLKNFFFILLAKRVFFSSCFFFILYSLHLS